MPISANRLDVQALSVEFVDASIRVILDDGREISAPLDEDVSVNALLGLPT
jgi:hypothetical protein